METIVRIIWDDQHEENLLNTENIKLALSEQFKDVNFVVIETDKDKVERQRKSNIIIEMERLTYLYKELLHLNLDVNETLPLKEKLCDLLKQY